MVPVRTKRPCIDGANTSQHASGYQAEASFLVGHWLVNGAVPGSPRTVHQASGLASGSVAV